MKLVIRPEVEPYRLATLWSNVDMSVGQLKLYSWHQDIEKTLRGFEELKTHIEELEKMYTIA